MIKLLLRVRRGWNTIGIHVKDDWTEGLVGELSRGHEPYTTWYQKWLLTAGRRTAVVLPLVPVCKSSNVTINLSAKMISERL